MFRLANGNSLEQLHAVAARLAELLGGQGDGGAGLVLEEFYSDPNPDNSLVVKGFACRDGGTANTTEKSYDDANYFSDGSVLTMEFDECKFGSFSVHGIIKSIAGGPSVDAGIVYTYEPSESLEFRYEDEAVGESLSVQFAYTNPDAVDFEEYGGGAESWGGRGLSGRSEPFGFFAVESYEALVRVDSSTAERTFSVRYIPRPGGTVVITTSPFVRAGDAERYSTGSLSMENREFTYVLDADSGDAATFLLTEIVGESTTTNVVPWESVVGFRDFDPESVATGL